MTPANPLHVRTLPMAFGEAVAVLAVASLAVAAVAYLFYRDYRGVFREVRR